MGSDCLSFDVFAALVNEAEEMHKGADIFWRKPEYDVNELRILRRWNSHSPSIADVLGGGYFLRWLGKGTIIDPGCSFLKLWRGWTHYSFCDIDMIIVTHDHVDHCQDLGTLVSLFRQFNKWQVKKNNEAPRIWDMIVSYGVADQLISLLNHPDNAPFLFWRKVLADCRQKVSGPQDVPGFLKDAKQNGLLSGDAYLSAFLLRAETPLTERYFYALEVLPAKHKELLGASTAFGLRFALKQKPNGTGIPEKACTIVISGDTALRDNADLAKEYGEADLVVLHVGGMEEPGKLYAGDHLCFKGVVKVLETVASNSIQIPKLVVLTEWGYEFGRAGLYGRTQFTRFVADELNSRTGFQGKFHAAVADPDGQQPVRPPDGAIVILPADIGLRIQLPGLEIFVESSGAKGAFLDLRKVYARESGERIDYLPV